VSLDSEKTKLAESLLRALSATRAWPATRRLQYLVTLGVKNRKAEFTREFGGDAMPEPDSVATIVAPASASLPLIKLLYVLEQSDDLCLDAPTARSITGEPSIAKLIRAVKDAEDAALVRRTAPAPRELAEADRDSLVGLTLTEEGRRYLASVLHLDETIPASATW
jgi:hypothetical protein